MQLLISIFSIFAVSLIQRRTPERLLGRVMAYTSAVTLCAQPAGQVVYEVWLDAAGPGLGWVLAATGLAVMGAAGLSAGVFRRLEEGQDPLPGGS